MTVLSVGGFVACAFLGLMAATMVGLIWLKKIDLGSLISEANGQASMSRFQLLIFTFVIAIGLFTLVEKRGDGTFPPIPDGVLTLLGISASTYAVGKGISYSQPDLMRAPALDTQAAKQAAADASAHADAAKAAAIASIAAATKSAGHMAEAQDAASLTAQDARTAVQAAQVAVDASVESDPKA